MINLKKLRLEHKLSQQKLAEKFGITQQAIFNYENGITEPDIYMLKQFAEFFNTSIDYLVGYTDNPYTHKDAQIIVEMSAGTRNLHYLKTYERLTANMKTHVDAILDELASKNEDEE